MTQTLWLASRSPRRKQLLEWAGWAVRCEPADIDERWDPTVPPVEHALNLAKGKAALAPSTELALAADTVVHADGVLFDKPINRTEAFEHLSRLSGRWHTVTTGVMAKCGPRQQWFSVHTEVRFRSIVASEIERYLATGDADDKAGAYGIQGPGGFLIAELRGSWTNVMGLPVEETLAALRKVQFP